MWVYVYAAVESTVLSKGSLGQRKNWGGLPCAPWCVGDRIWPRSESIPSSQEEPGEVGTQQSWDKAGANTSANRTRHAGVLAAYAGDPRAICDLREQGIGRQR